MKQGRTPFLAAVLALVVGCATAEAPTPVRDPPALDSLVPGTIGVVVRNTPGGVAVATLRKGVDGLREGDLVLRYNGFVISTAREFNRLVVDSRPGSTARLEVRRDGEVREVQLPVRALDTEPHA